MRRGLYLLTVAVCVSLGLPMFATAAPLSAVAADHPVTRWVTLSDVNIDKSNVFVPREGDVVLARSIRDPLVVAGKQDGKKFVGIPLFDGMSDSGAQDSAVAILGWFKPEKSAFPSLSDVPFTRVHIAFFGRSTSSCVGSSPFTSPVRAAGRSSP